MKKLSKVEIARRIRDNRYKIECPYPGDKGRPCSGCKFKEFCAKRVVSYATCPGVYANREAVDNYIKRYNRPNNGKRTVKKSLKVSRPNFVKAIKEGKEFNVPANKKYGEELQKIAFSLGLFWISSLNRDVHNTDKVLVFSKIGRYGITWRDVSSGYNPNYPIYHPETDTFSDEEVKPETVKDLEEPKEDYTECLNYAEGGCLLEGECESESCPLNVQNPISPQPIKVPEDLFFMDALNIRRIQVEKRVTEEYPDGSKTVQIKELGFDKHYNEEECLTYDELKNEMEKKWGVK